jgi:phosphotriesterase-related protein
MGCPPYTQVTHQVLPALRERGVTQKQIEQMMFGNPRRVFESRALGPY